MSKPKVFIDGFLLNWGDKLFYPPIRKHQQRVVKSLSWTAMNLPNKSSQIRVQIARTTQRSPEVMVKITSKKNAGKGMITIRHHLDYISRNGKIQLEDHEGRLLNGRADVNDIKHDWAAEIPEISHRRETINVMFSMKKGTPSEGVKEAVRAYLTEEFGGKHEYLFALHTDADNPHVHVVINMSPIRKKDKRLNPRKNDLQRWREGFAENLRKLGIDANATPRKTRGVVKQPKQQYQLHQLARSATATQHTAPLKPPVLKLGKAKKLLSNHAQQTQAWANIASALASSQTKSDRVLAKDVIAFMAEQPIRHINKPNLNKNAQRALKADKSVEGDILPLPRVK
ncbi:MAG: relaxase/mobilization nuclease domain-containing protein [Methylotenera sp.]